MIETSIFPSGLNKADLGLKRSSMIVRHVYTRKAIAGTTMITEELCFDEVQTTFEDVIPIEPNDFTKPSRAALEDNINEKFSNKVN